MVVLPCSLAHTSILPQHDAFLLFLFKCCCMSLFLSGLFPCLSMPLCWSSLGCTFPAAYSVPKVPSADLRRVSAPPDSFAMWVLLFSLPSLKCPPLLLAPPLPTLHGLLCAHPSITLKHFHPNLACPMRQLLVCKRGVLIGQRSCGGKVAENTCPLSRARALPDIPVG